ncbi:MAG TPA: hypothetical protein VJ840_00455 [Gemmatimonadaceae bacterium]|nr:hypothetical protein [Gemmatimonadaceae bacterium]
MPAAYEIDAVKGVVTTRFWGVVTDDEVSEHDKRLRSDPNFNPGYRQLVDMSGITKPAVTSRMIFEAALDQFFAPGSRRAIIATDDTVFGLARMFALHSERAGQTIEVYRERARAEEWLDG